MYVLHLTTYNEILLTITAVAICMFFLLASVLMVVAWKLVNKLKRVATKAESAIDSVEEATEAIKNISTNAGGPLAFFKMVKAMVDSNRKK